MSEDDPTDSPPSRRRSSCYPPTSVRLTTDKCPMCPVTVPLQWIIISAMASQITGVSIVYSTIKCGTDQRQHQSSASLAFVRGIHRRPVNSPHKRPVTRKLFSFDDVITRSLSAITQMSSHAVQTKMSDQCLATIGYRLLRSHSYQHNICL